jgi:hypothetical protein
MSEIYAELQTPAFEVQPLQVPVSVLRPNGALVRGGLTRDPVTVEPGQYVVVARLPAGAQLTGRVEVGTDESAHVWLSPEPEDESPHETHGIPHFIWGRAGLDLSSDAETAAFTMNAKLTLWSGNVFAGSLSMEPDNSLRQVDHDSLPDGMMGFEPTASTGLNYIQLAQPGYSPINVVLGSEGCRGVVTLRPDNRFDLEVRLRHAAADALLSFMEHGRGSDAEAMTHSAALGAEELLYEKKRYPIAAAAGAYMLLRLGEIDRLHHWTQNLCNWFEWLPDGLVVRAEHLARTGHEDEAIAHLCRLPERGLPIFTEGLSLAQDRLRRSPSRPARDVLRRMLDFIPFVDFTQTFVTYHGLDPGTAGLDSLDGHVYNDIRALEIGRRGVLVT